MDDDQIHAGYRYEDGMFSRMRSWVDVISWIRLARVLRILSSPLYVLWVVLVCGVTRLVVFLILDLPASQPPTTTNWMDFPPTILTGNLAGPLVWGLSTISSQRPVPSVIFLLMMIPIWIPTFQIVSRAGAGLTAGKDLPGFLSTLRLSFGRLGWSCLVLIVPAACVAVFSIGLVVICFPSLAFNIPWLSIVTGWLAGLFTILVGVLAFGGLFAIPAGLVAIVVEPSADPMDSVSRGYEYLYRRPLALIGYGLVVSVIVALIEILIGGICWSASQIAAVLFSDYWRNEEFQLAVQQAIASVRLGWMITIVFASAGGVYLLMRRAACGQEVEEFWEPATATPDPLPSLPKETLDQ